MQKKELLSPAGDFETLKQAIHNGCDAVYLSGKKFGARKFAKNFDEEELKEAIAYSHLYGVKVYVTVNTLIYEREIEEVLNYIEFLHRNGVDAVIMQDLGLISCVHDRFPNLEIHASTQMHNHDANGLKLLKELGVTRVVLARELSLEEINNLAQTTDLELEVFIHGALCICYSGQCLFSSLLLDRSGNRGECAGICRLPFSLYEEENKVPTSGKYLLSPKELNELTNMEALMHSSITSFKIEGRMKSPTTIGYITRLYRKMINQIENGEKPILSAQENKNLHTLFNREFTSGYLFQEKDQQLINSKSPNHYGIPLGQVIAVTKKKIKIKLQEDLNQEDGIRFLPENKGMIVNYIYDQKGLWQKEAKAHTIIEVDNKIGLEKAGGTVRKTIDHQLEEELKQYTPKKIPVILTVSASKESKKIKVSLSDGKNLVEKEEQVVEPATTNPTTASRIIQQLQKMGSTPFVVMDIKQSIDEDIFIPIKVLNEIRRSLTQELEDCRRNQKPEIVINKKDTKLPSFSSPLDKPSLTALVRNGDQLKICLEENLKAIYITEESLFQKYQHLPNVYLRLSRLNSPLDFSPSRVLLGELSSLIPYQKASSKVTDYYLNVTNSQTVSYLRSHQVERVTLSVECKDEDIEAIIKAGTNPNGLEVIVYGRLEAMIMKYRPLTLFNTNNTECSHTLVDRNQEKYPILEEKDGTHLLYYKPLDRNLETLLEMGISTFRLEFFDEDKTTTRNIIKKYQNRLIKLDEIW